ncbi:uncharacterized protein LOC107030046 [Solanum pennellii]|uniref:Uncharacterized protein LOC107030046 n=1 Tax=Solanum pennellii TaxID=28526 RepID=A0ABM1HKV1_SOLPN|nr:uncharacterized protein LOC107030046 [Solanum pennellii]
MNPPSFTDSSTTEDPKSELKKVFNVMHVVGTESVELVSYQNKSVARTWFDLWKDGKAKDAPQPSMAFFEEAFMWVVLSSRTERSKGSAGCFKCGQIGTFIRECQKSKIIDGSGGNRAHFSSASPPYRAAPRGATSGFGEGTNCLHALNNCHEQEN